MKPEELLKVYFANKHILQSAPWGEFKTIMGTKAVRTAAAQFTLHKIPLTPFKIGYCPKIKPEDVDFQKIFEAAKNEGCVAVKLDVPHTGQKFEIRNSKFEICQGKSVFAQSTILMDLTKSDDEILSGMHEKTRYNLRLAQKKGVKVQVYPDPATPTRSHLVDAAVERFIRLQKKTADRQKFFVHSNRYYQTAFETLVPHGMAFLLEARVADGAIHDTETAASWILFRYGDVLYYPYGESNYELRPYMASNLVMWEALQLGKKLGCKVFDLWGAADDPNDESDPWHGFTRFKLSFGGTHVKLSPTYDLAINSPLYKIFEFSNNLRWKLLRVGR